MVSKLRNALGCGCLGTTGLLLLIALSAGRSQVNTHRLPPSGESAIHRSKPDLSQAQQVTFGDQSAPRVEPKTAVKNAAEPSGTSGALLQTAVDDHSMTGRFAPNWQVAIRQNVSQRIVAEKRRIRRKYGDDNEETYQRIDAMQHWSRLNDDSCKSS